MHHRAVIRLRRQRRIYELHRYRLRRQPRPRRSPHRRQVRWRRCRHHPVLRFHLPRPQLLHHGVVHASRHSSRIRRQRHTECPIRSQVYAGRSRSDRRPFRGHKCRPRDDQRPRRRSSVREIHRVRNGGCIRPTLRRSRKSKGRKPKPSRYHRRPIPIKKPPHRAAACITHRNPPKSLRAEPTKLPRLVWGRTHSSVPRSEARARIH